MAKAKSAPTKVTRIEDIKPPIVELPGWDQDQPFYARLRRVSLLNLIERGELPNELLKIAHKLTTAKQGRFNPFTDSTPEELVEFTRLLHNFARAALVEPTYQELEENGIFLTDLQLTAIFQYCQKGVQALALFRERPAAPAPARGDGQGVGDEAEQLPAGTGDI